MVKEIKMQTTNEELKPKIEAKTILEKVDEDHDFIKQIKEGQIKVRNLKIPRKAKVRRSKLKKGWVGILKIDENGNVSGEKVKISGGAFNTKSGTYHATDGRELLYWMGKFPFLVQPTWKKNPLHLRLKPNETNETYGDPYIKAKLLRDVIKVKKSGGGIIVWILIAIGGYIGYQFLLGGGL